MTAAKMVGVIARLPVCDGQATDAPRLFKNSKVRVSRCMDTSSTTQMAEVLGEHGRSRGTSRTKFRWTSVSRIVVGKTIGGSAIGTWMGRSAKVRMSVCSPKTRIIFSVYVVDIKISGKKQNMAPIWKKLIKNVGLEEPTSLLDRTLRECKPNEVTIEQYNKDV